MMMKKLMQVLVTISATLMLGGCKLMMLDPKGLIAAEEVRILVLSVLLMLIVVIPVILLSLIFSWRYREGNHKAAYRPEWSHNVWLEVIWWSIPCVIIAILATVTWISSHTLDPYRPITQASKYKPITIEVIALEWKWLFIYPEQNIATVNFLQIPVGVPIKFEITSEGPMNSFLIPQLAGQIYAMAGMRSQLNLIANEEGDYAGFSSNFSGDGFSGMKFNTHVTSYPAFEEWVNTVKQHKNVLDKSAYDLLAVPSQDNPVTYYSSVNRYLFKISLMKAMMPLSEVNSLCKERSWV